MPSLLEKLRSLDAETARSDTKIQPPASSPPLEYRCASFPLSLFGDLRPATPQRLSAVFQLNFPRDFRKEDLIFLDTETTGLSGGAGTLAFQIGIGYFRRERFWVEQYLMRSYSQENEMLQKVSRLLQSHRVLCSFNGRSFDAPLLESRLAFCRISPQCIPSLHADVLYPARRLWKLRLKKCNLSHLEEELLGIHREDDLPGAEVPQTYFRYLEDGNFDPLNRVLEHNQQDIISLAQLLFLICRHTSEPQRIMEQQDLFSLAAEYRREKDIPSAKKCYRMLSGGSFRKEAYRALALQEKHDGQYLRAVRLYQSMISHGDDAPEACEALAKLYEHQLHDISLALHYTELGLLILSEPVLSESESVQNLRNALQYRYTRLRKHSANLGRNHRK